MALVEGTQGNDTLNGTVRPDTIRGFGGDDSIIGSPGGDLYFGGDGNDTITSSAFTTNTVFGGAGTDRIVLEAGTAYGGDGDDTITGAGAATLYGDVGNDVLSGGFRTQTMYGGEGDDLIYGDISGAGGQDTVYGGAGSDTIYAAISTRGRNFIEGGESDDLIYGGGVADTIYGGDGFDQIFAGVGNDVIAGGGGDDIIYGGTGDTMTGGAGNDAFFWEGTDAAVITDFGSSDGNRDTVNLGALFNESTLETYNARMGTSFTTPFQALNDDLRDGDIDFAGPDGGPESARLTLTGVTGIDADQTDVACFAAGTMIRTVNGDVAVETLGRGDPILTMDNGYKEVVWIGSIRLDAAALAADPKLRPIRIPQGALGMGLPARPLLVSPQHRVFVRSVVAERMVDAPEILVAAKHLVGTAGIHIAEDVTEVEYWHFLFDQHEIVWSNGAPTESMFTGPEALKSVAPAARAEILTLFPALALVDYRDLGLSVRPILKGRQGRTLAKRHFANNKPLLGKG